MRKIIHVHQAEVKHNDPDDHPAIIVRTHKGSTRHREVEILGPSVLCHSSIPDACGARVWIVTEAEVVADGHTIGQVD